MSTEGNWLAGTFGFTPGRTTTPGPVTPIHQPPLLPGTMPQREAGRLVGEWRAPVPLHDDGFPVPNATASELPRIFLRLGRQHPGGYRTDCLHWPDAVKYGFTPFITTYTHRTGLG